MDSQQRIAELEAELRAKDAQIAERDARIAELEQQVALLLEQVAALKEQLGQNSRNSNKPPSGDAKGRGGNPGQRKKKSGRKRGGQPGHKGSHRKLLPEDEVDEFVHHFPSECESCWNPLPEVEDPNAARFQFTEVPPVLPHTTEHRCHTVRCNCGHRTRAKWEDDIPSSPFGPRLMSLVALLTGVYHLSRRRATTLLSELLGVQLSLGAVSAIEARASEAVAEPVDEAWQKLGDSSVYHTDGTGWLKAGAALAVWTIATTAVTVFKIVANNSKKTLEPLFDQLRGILVSDRAAALNFWAMGNRQVCWSHLIRKFVSFAERDGPAGAIGRELLDYTAIMFEYWHAYKDGQIDRSTLQSWMRPVRSQVEAVLERGKAAGIRGLSGSCADILAHRLALWTFIDHEGVEPTNNHAEQQLRAFVLWRKRSYGSQSERGDRFAERMMTVAHTARKQNRDVLAFLTECCEAYCTATAAPSLFTAA